MKAWIALLALSASLAPAAARAQTPVDSLALARQYTTWLYAGEAEGLACESEWVALVRAVRKQDLAALHALFERLPGVSASERLTLALRWLERAGVPADARQEIADAACSLIADPAYADLFGADALAEAPIAATLPDGRVIAGTVDRLCIGAELVRVIDFKTGRNVPADLDSVPAGHRAQMQAYTEALKVIFPDRKIDASLLYTDGPRLIRVTG